MITATFRIFFVCRLWLSDSIVMMTASASSASAMMKGERCFFFITDFPLPNALLHFYLDL